MTQPAAEPSPLDLTTVDNVKALMSPNTNAQDDGNIQRLVTAASSDLGKYCSRIFAAQEYTEIRNGRGEASSLEALQAPIVPSGVVSVTIGSYSVPVSTGLINYGFVADEERIYIRQGAYGGNWMAPYGWGRGVMNIQLVYWAGYQTPGQVGLDTTFPGGIVPLPLPSELEQACIEYVILVMRQKGQIGDTSYGVGPDKISHYLKSMTARTQETIQRARRVNLPLR